MGGPAIDSQKQNDVTGDETVARALGELSVEYRTYFLSLPSEEQKLILNTTVDKTQSALLAAGYGIRSGLSPTNLWNGLKDNAGRILMYAGGGCAAGAGISLLPALFGSVPSGGISLGAVGIACVGGAGRALTLGSYVSLGSRTLEASQDLYHSLVTSNLESSIATYKGVRLLTEGGAVVLSGRLTQSAASRLSGAIQQSRGAQGGSILPASVSKPRVDPPKSGGGGGETFQTGSTVVSPDGLKVTVTLTTRATVREAVASSSRQSSFSVLNRTELANASRIEQPAGAFHLRPLHLRAAPTSAPSRPYIGTPNLPLTPPDFLVSPYALPPGQLRDEAFRKWFRVRMIQVDQSGVAVSSSPGTSSSDVSNRSVEEDLDDLFRSLRTNRNSRGLKPEEVSSISRKLESEPSLVMKCVDFALQLMRLQRFELASELLQASPRLVEAKQSSHYQDGVEKVLLYVLSFTNFELIKSMIDLRLIDQDRVRNSGGIQSKLSEIITWLLLQRGEDQALEQIAGLNVIDSRHERHLSIRKDLIVHLEGSLRSSNLKLAHSILSLGIVTLQDLGPSLSTALSDCVGALVRADRENELPEMLSLPTLPQDWLDTDGGRLAFHRAVRSLLELGAARRVQALLSAPYVSPSLRQSVPGIHFIDLILKQAPGDSARGTLLRQLALSRVDDLPSVSAQYPHIPPAVLPALVQIVEKSKEALAKLDAWCVQLAHNGSLRTRFLDAIVSVSRNAPISSEFARSLAHIPLDVGSSEEFCAALERWSLLWALDTVEGALGTRRTIRQEAILRALKLGSWREVKEALDAIIQPAISAHLPGADLDPVAFARLMNDYQGGSVFFEMLHTVPNSSVALGKLIKLLADQENFKKERYNQLRSEVHEAIGWASDPFKARWKEDFAMSLPFSVTTGVWISRSQVFWEKLATSFAIDRGALLPSFDSNVWEGAINRDLVEDLHSIFGASRIGEKHQKITKAREAFEARLVLIVSALRSVNAGAARDALAFFESSPELLNGSQSFAAHVRALSPYLSNGGQIIQRYENLRSAGHAIRISDLFSPADISSIREQLQKDDVNRGEVESRWNNGEFLSKLQVESLRKNIQHVRKMFEIFDYVDALCKSSTPELTAKLKKSYESFTQGLTRSSAKETFQKLAVDLFPSQVESRHFALLFTDNPRLTWFSGMFPRDAKSCVRPNDRKGAEALFAVVGSAHIKSAFVVDINRLPSGARRIIQQQGVAEGLKQISEDQILGATVLVSTLKAASRDSAPNLIVGNAYESANVRDFNLLEGVIRALRSRFDPVRAEVVRPATPGHGTFVVKVPKGWSPFGQYEDGVTGGPTSNGEGIKLESYPLTVRVAGKETN